MGRLPKYTVQNFIDDANRIYDYKYDYPLDLYNNYFSSNIKVKIICPIHGEFKKRVSRHIKEKQGCPKCLGKRNTAYTTDEFISEVRKIHGDIFLYDRVKYINQKTKIEIGCKIHGYFLSSSNHLLVKKGKCKKCSMKKIGESKRKSQNTFLQQAQKIHGDRYDYSKVEYITHKKYIIIKCKIHGEFNQTPRLHLLGFGCKKCTPPRSKGEEYIKKFLKENNINFEIEKSFEGCKYKKNLRFDFYIPEQNKLIEFDGEQHYKIRKMNNWGGAKRFFIEQKRDRIKNKFCKDNKIPLLRIPYEQYKNIDNLLIEFLELKNSFY